MKRRLSHTVGECKYHIVRVPKKRCEVIYRKLCGEIGTILRRLCEYKGVEVLIRKSLYRSHSHLPFDTTQIFSINYSGLFKREECDDRI